MRNRGEWTVRSLLGCSLLAFPLVAVAATPASAGGGGAAAVVVDGGAARPLRALTETALRDEGLSVFVDHEVDWPKRLGPRGAREMAQADVERVFALRVDRIGHRPLVVLDELRLDDRKLVARATASPLYMENLPEVIPPLVRSLLSQSGVNGFVTAVSPEQDSRAPASRVFRAGDPVVSLGSFGSGLGGSLGYETGRLRIAAALSVGSNESGALVGGLTAFMSDRSPITPFAEVATGLVGVEGDSGLGVLVNGGLALGRDRTVQALLGAGVIVPTFSASHSVYPTARIEISFR
jgi:hypothetical protein